MLRRETAQDYQEFTNDNVGYTPAIKPEDNVDKMNYSEADGHILPGGDADPANGNITVGFSKTCLKSFFSILLIFIYLLLTTVALFLAYQTITDLFEKLKHPVMSVTFKEIDFFEAPGIAFYPQTAKFLSCKHHYHDFGPPPESLGKREKGDCIMEEVIYNSPYSNKSKRALVVRGPTDVRNRELIFLQFSQNETEDDFSAISYLLFHKYSDMAESLDKSEFMKKCEQDYSIWTFSGGFRTWVKMSLVRTSGKRNESVEFRQESSVVKYNDRRPESERANQLFFIVFEWRDPFIQEVRDIITANTWNTVAILCGVFMALFKVANFAKLSVQWMMKIRRAHRKRREREMTCVT